MSAGILNLEIDQGATFEKRMYFLSKRIITAVVDASVTSLIGSNTLTIMAGGIGAINVGDFILLKQPDTEEYASYKVTVGIADLSLGGILTLASPLRQVVQGDAIIVAHPMDLTNSTFTSQMRVSADSPDIIATFICTLATNPLDGYYDLFLDDATTSAIPTTGKTDYTKKARFTCDGELRIGGRVARTYNGTVLVSPETTKAVV